MLKAAEHEERMELYKLGLSDGEIARRLFTTRSAILQWRRKYGLVRNCTRGRGDVDHKKLLKAIKEGASAKDAAEEAGCSEATARRLMKKLYGTSRWRYY